MAAVDKVTKRIPWIRPHTPLGWLLEAVLVTLLAGGLIILAARVGPLTYEAKRFIEAGASGIEVGPLGRLRIEGLSGDIWREFRLKRVTISDTKGVWLEADDVTVTWRYLELLRSRLHINALSIGHLHLMRQPMVRPSKPGGKPPDFRYANYAIKAQVDLV